MDKEKQIEKQAIEEMVNTLWHLQMDLHLDCYNDCVELSKILNEEKYRKQSEDCEKRIANQREEIRRLRTRINGLTQSRGVWKKQAERVGKQLHEVLSKQEWISVEEKLPEIDKNGKGRYGGERSVRVLCVCKQSGGKTFVKEGYYEPCANGSVFWRIPGSIDSVTYWMPLPAPPKGGVE